MIDRGARAPICHLLGRRVAKILCTISGMESGDPFRIVSAQRMEDGLLIEFDDGECAVYPTAGFCVTFLP